MPDETTDFLKLPDGGIIMRGAITAVLPDFSPEGLHHRFHVLIDYGYPKLTHAISFDTQQARDDYLKTITDLLCKPSAK